jgi:hypothetical protein
VRLLHLEPGYEIQHSYHQLYSQEPTSHQGFPKEVHPSAQIYYLTRWRSAQTTRT